MPLDYSQTPGGAPRWQFRFLLILTCLNSAILLWMNSGSLAWHAWQQLRVHRIAAATVAAPTTAPNVPAALSATVGIDDRFDLSKHPEWPVVYDESQTGASRLLSEHGDRYAAVPLDGSDAQAFMQRGWQAPVYGRSAAADGFKLDWFETPLFQCRVSKPSGERRQVAVSMKASVRRAFIADKWSVVLSRKLVFHVVRPAVEGPGAGLAGLPAAELCTVEASGKGIAIDTITTKGDRVFFDDIPDNLLRIYACQLDPADQSHFVVPISIGANNGSIDCRLTGDENVERSSELWTETESKTDYKNAQ